MDRIPTIPPYPGADARAKISPARWQTAVNIMSRQLDVVLGSNDSAAFSKACLPFVTGYLRDAATARIHTPKFALPSMTEAETALRRKTFQVLERLASTPNATNVQLLMDSSIVYEQKNHTRMNQIAADAISSTPSILAAISSEVLPAFTSALTQARLGNNNASSLPKTAYCIVRLLRCGDSIVDLFFRKDFILALANAFGSEVSSDTDSMQTKANIMDAFHLLMGSRLSRLSQTKSAKEAREELYDILFALFEQASAAPSTSTKLPSIDQPLLTVYESSYHFSDTLSSIDTGDDSTKEYLVHALQGLRDSRIQSATSMRERHSPNGTATKGKLSSQKGKAKAVDPEPADRVTHLELRTSQVLDILPDEDPAFIRTSLRHPTYSDSVENLIAALIEDKLPPDLAAKRHGVVQAPQQPASLLDSRRNVFEDQPLDFSRLRIGKNRSENADSVLQDRSFLDAVKADILRRVQELSDEDEEEGEKGPRERIVAFEEELDEEGPVRSTVSVANDGEESGATDSEEEGVEVVAKPNIDLILEQTYLQDPKLFDRDANTRRTKQRADLRTRTGWTDEQLEGWKIMLERNPRKDKILQKHELAGNRPLQAEEEGATSSAHASDREPGPSARGRGSRGGGRAGGGGGRGRGGRGGGEARERAWKDKNKARQGNHDRKRGHDKKMARGAGPPA